MVLLPPSFGCRAREQAFTLQWNRQLVLLDLPWSIWGAIFIMTSIAKWVQSGRELPWSEVQVAVGYAVWSPCQLWLMCYRPQWYVRHRNAYVMCMRLTRMLLLMTGAGFLQRESSWSSTSDFTMPQHVTNAIVHLGWKALSMLVVSLAFVLPIRQHLPLMLLRLLLSLSATAQQCLLECPGSAGCAADGGMAGLLSLAASAAAGGVTGTATEGAAGQALACASAYADSGRPRLREAQRYYRRIRDGIRRLVPGVQMLHATPHASSSGSRAECVKTCFAVHSWLQCVGGVLLPLAFLWTWEQHARQQMLHHWTIQQEQRQQQQQQGGDARAAAGEEQQQEREGQYACGADCTHMQPADARQATEPPQQPQQPPQQQQPFMLVLQAAKSLILSVLGPEPEQNQPLAGEQASSAGVARGGRLASFGRPLPKLHLIAWLAASAVLLWLQVELMLLSAAQAGTLS